MVMKWRLKWAGDLVRLEDSQIPKQALYAELLQNKWQQCKLRKWYKDCLIDTLNKVNVETSISENLRKAGLKTELK